MQMCLLLGQLAFYVFDHLMMVCFQLLAPDIAAKLVQHLAAPGRGDHAPFPCPLAKGWLSQGLPLSHNSVLKRYNITFFKNKVASYWLTFLHQVTKGWDEHKLFTCNMKRQFLSTALWYFVMTEPSTS